VAEHDVAAVMAASAAPSSLSRFELEAELAALRGEVAELKQLVAVLREENARLKGLTLLWQFGSTF
jgi:uncharacterized protein YceH (UPF0502 family)